MRQKVSRLRAECVLVFSIVLMLFVWSPAAAQDNFRDVIEMSVEVGFDSTFRPGDWTPVVIRLKNNGESLTGRVVIRPETSGTVVGNAFGSPVELPSGAEKSALLNIRARSFPDKIRVELIDKAGAVRAVQDAGLVDLSPQDQLFAVVIGPNTAPLNLSAVHIGGFEAEQAIWAVHDIPEFGASLESLDMILLINIDSESLSSGQRQAIRHWVEGGGHLIVAGGPSALITTSGLTEILPLQPADSQTVDDLSSLARYAGDNQAGLTQRAVIALGEVHEEARVLVEQDGIPLLLRRELGAGLVDFIAADPTLEPLLSWDNLSDLWLKLLATRAPHPAWREGFTRPDWGAEAVANLPGVDLLPPMQTLCLFLAAYIGLIGPLNYIILSRLRRNGWGWFTIPLVIVCFAIIAWTVGFNLRGTEIILSRLTFVEAYADSEEAQTHQFVGLLSPRRATYSLTAPEGHSLAVAGATTPSSIFASNTIQTATEIWQGTSFGARDFTVDGGIFANFSLSGRIAKPAIGGSFTLDYEILESGRMVGAYQGALSNQSDVTLRDAVLIGEGLVHPLERDLAPGEIITLGREELRVDVADRPAQPNPLELRLSAIGSSLSPFSGSSHNMSIKHVQGERYMRSRGFLRAESTADRQAAREQAFLASFMLDQFQSVARGTRLFLAGWSDAWGRDLTISGAGWSSIDTSLYIIELDVEIELPRERATLTSEHFSWITLDRQGITDNGTDNFSLFEGQSVEFLFHPLPGLALDVVDRLLVDVDRGGGFAQALAVELYDWTRGEYETFPFSDGGDLEFSQPGRFLGPGNAVRIRLEYGDGFGTLRVRNIRIEQTGRYY
ncbi:MAG: hypothetical protein OXG78_03350 [Chloroflexi bacterium]|nr:hypothetical protein [Chloroflexota bacterium]